MSKTSPILILEDDPDDRDLVEQALRELQVSNPVRFFSKSQEALYYLMDTREQPRLILSDINMPGMDGLELRRKINESHYLHRKSIPFIFLTTSQLEENIIRAYDLMAQGYFVKPDSFDGLKKVLQQILSYWELSRYPNNAIYYQALGTM
jgi:CheY-like chemotaxis protein